MATIEKRIYDGNRAREILENEAFQQVFEDIEKELYQAWAESPQRDAEGRERVHQYLSMLKKVKAQLTSALESGKLASLDLEHKQTITQRAKAFVRAVNG